MTNINTDRKIGLFAPSGYGKSYLADRIVRSIRIPVMIYDTDYEATTKAYFRHPNVQIFRPEDTRSEDLDYLNEYLKTVTAMYTNRFIYVEDLDVFFDGNNQLGKEARLLKNIASKGRHHRIGFIYSAKQLAFIPSKLIGNTNLFYVGKFVAKQDVERLRNIVSMEEMDSLGEHEFWEIDRISGTKRKIKV